MIDSLTGIQTKHRQNDKIFERIHAQHTQKNKKKIKYMRQLKHTHRQNKFLKNEEQAKNTKSNLPSN